MAFAWLKNAYEAHQADIESLKIDSALDTLRSEPRSADLLRRIVLSG